MAEHVNGAALVSPLFFFFLFFWAQEKSIWHLVKVLRLGFPLHAHQCVSVSFLLPCQLLPQTSRNLIIYLYSWVGPIPSLDWSPLFRFDEITILSFYKYWWTMLRLRWKGGHTSQETSALCQTWMRNNKCARLSFDSRERFVYFL